MQNRYVCDVGDFGKFGLLRSLANGFSLGVVWYLTPDEGHNADGKHISYLEFSAANTSKFRECDPTLYQGLSDIVLGAQRAVQSVEERGVLPAGTIFHTEPLSFQGMQHIGARAREARLYRRQQWVNRALQSTRECDIVFLDPDNGFESKIERHTQLGPKFAYFDEVQSYLNRGQSVIVYHHLGRNGNVYQQVNRLLARLEQRLVNYQQLSALLYRRGTVRAFVVITAPGYDAVFPDRIRSFLDSPWSRHFEYLTTADA